MCYDTFLSIVSMQFLNRTLLGKAIDVIHQMATDVVRVTLEFTEVELAVVVKAQRVAVLILGQVVEDGVAVGDLLRQCAEKT